MPTPQTDELWILSFGTIRCSAILRVPENEIRRTSGLGSVIRRRGSRLPPSPRNGLRIGLSGKVCLRAGTVGNGPSPNLGRRPPPNRPKLKAIFSRPLSRALQKVWVFRLFDPGPGPSGGPRKVPLGYPWAFPRHPEASRRPPGPKTNQSQKPRNVSKRID